MYTQITKNQEKLQTNQQTPLNIIFNQEYYSSCTPLQKRILQYFQTFRFDINKVRHEVVARKINCSTKTVQRATNKFKEDGVLFKSQANPYSPNKYQWQSDAFTICNPFENTRPTKLRTENVQQVKYIRNIYKEDVINDVIMYSREREAGKMTKEMTTQMTEKQKTGRRMTAESENNEMTEQQQREMTMADIASYFNPNPVEEFKLLVYQYEALAWAYKELESSLQRVKGANLDDTWSWFLAQCKKYSIQHNLPMNWQKFYTLCSQAGLNPNERSNPRPLYIPPHSGRPPQKAKSDNSAKSNYKPKQWEKDVPSRDEQIAKLTKSIEFSLQELQDPNHPKRLNNKFYDIETAKMWIEKDLKELENLQDYKEPEPVPESHKQKLFANFGSILN